MSGVKDLREAMARPSCACNERNQRTVLFVDEIHRFNKAQQDALLPHVEAGTVILVGATTENPSFEVNAALLSRTKVLVLEPLDEADLRADRRPGAGRPRARSGRASSSTWPTRGAGPDRPRGPRATPGGRCPRWRRPRRCPARTPPACATSTHRRWRRRWRARRCSTTRPGDEHYDVVSAFIKSMRGTDPDAAVYWMARMLEAGEDPVFVLRRMVIFAAEDVGNADPRALSVAVSALDAFRLVGLPEGVLPMTQAVLYLAAAPKSNTALTTYAAAKADVDAHGALPVPSDLRNAPTPLARSLGFGAGYQYPHDFEGHYVAQQYLPDRLQGQRYYEPTESGEESAIKRRLESLREGTGAGAKKK